MSEIVEFFNELMFGSGAWFGLILVLSIALLVSYKAKYSSAIFIMILAFMGLQYLEEIGGKISLESSFCWAFIINCIGIVILGYIFLGDAGLIGKKKR